MAASIRSRTSTRRRCFAWQRCAIPGSLTARSGRRGESIPPDIITRPPTAELRENQTDQDSLPPYDVLDAILERLVEREEPLASIVEAGFDRGTVARIDRLLNIAERKRRDGAPEVKVD